MTEKILNIYKGQYRHDPIDLGKVNEFLKTADGIEELSNEQRRMNNLVGRHGHRIKKNRHRCDDECGQKYKQMRSNCVELYNNILPIKDGKWVGDELLKSLSKKPEQLHKT